MRRPFPTAREEWLMIVIVLISTTLLTCAAAARPLESYSESLLVRRLDPHVLGLRLEFVSRKAGSQHINHPFADNQYETFPKLIGQVITRNVSDLRLVMTRGSWRWGGETLWPAVEAGAPGVEIWAKVKDPEYDWTRLVRALAGMTCASLDVLQKNSSRAIFGGVVFAAMPSETVCTENISPWLKLLPCRSRAGLGRLISAKTIVRSYYYSLALVTRRTDRGIELIQSLSVALPIKSSLAETLGVNGLRDALSYPCALASKEESHVVLETSQGSFQPAPDQLTETYASWRLPLSQGGDIAGLDTMGVYRPKTAFRSSKWQSGIGNLKGTFSTALYNDDPTMDLSVKHLEIIPSFLRPRLATLKIFVGSGQLSEERVQQMTSVTSTLLRGPPATFEFNLILPRNGTRVLVTFEFDKAFLSFDEFPPDPNRGFDVPSALSVYNRSSPERSKEDEGLPGILRRSSRGPVRRATEAHLVTLAHPDFSMPYNVITLSSTGFALFFGMLINISVRRRGDRWAPKTKGALEKLKEKCRRKPKSD